MKIGILTFHRAYNCGAVLQAWALKRVLEMQGHSVAVVDCNRVGDVPRFQKFVSPHTGLRRIVSWINYARIQILSLGAVDIRRHLFHTFLNQNLNLIRCDNSSIRKCFDKLVLGSDQIWNPSLMSDEEYSLFLGESLPISLAKIVYAASIGDKPLELQYFNRLVRAAREFEHISVREFSAGIGLLDKHGGSASVVADPSLLLTKDEYLEIANPKKMRKGKYVLVYTLHTTPFVCDCAEIASRELQLPVVVLAMYQYGLYRSPKNTVCGFGPAEFLAWIRDAECVLAASFHGTAFSIIFDKPFVSIREKMDKHESRPGSLLKQLGLENRLVTPASSTSWIDNLRMSLPSSVQKQLKELTRGSYSYIRQSI